jgi:hypothetical protein
VKDRNGAPLNVEDRVEYFRVEGGRTGGKALGWKGGMLCTVRELGGPGGMVLLEHDEKADYPPPHDRKLEWGSPRVIVKIADME